MRGCDGVICLDGRCQKSAFDISCRLYLDILPLLGNKRLTRRRSGKSNAFKAILDDAQKKSFAVLEAKYSKTEIIFRLIDDNNLEVGVYIRQSLHCTQCSQKQSKQTKQTCTHILWCLINELHVSISSSLLAQISLTDNEFRNLRRKNGGTSPDPAADTPIDPTDEAMHKEPINPRFTDAELKSIFEGNPAHVKKQLWYANKLLVRKEAKCASPSCRATMPEGKIYVHVTGLYIPPSQNFAIERTFYFCAQQACLSKKPFMSNIQSPPAQVMITHDSNLLAADISIMKSRNINVV